MNKSEFGDHANQCFVVMPYGRNQEQRRWYQGWYEQVIEKGVRKSGYTPILSALENTPSAINDEIRVHLAYDAMVVVDLGGFIPEEDPNPNVMYELGIRHALNLPVVIMGWKGQKLPFDISNQRAILEDRDFISIPRNIELLVEFINEATKGVFYKPMNAVVRSGILERATDELSNDNLLRTVVEEIRDWKEEIHRKRVDKWGGSPRKRRFVSGYIGSKQERRKLYEKFIEKGGTASQWGKILSTPINDEMFDNTIGWTITQWREYIFSHITSAEE